MPQMMPCWWLLIQFYVILLFMVVFVEIYFSFSPNKEKMSSSLFENKVFPSNFSLKSFLNE